MHLGCAGSAASQEPQRGGGSQREQQHERCCRGERGGSEGAVPRGQSGREGGLSHKGRERACVCVCIVGKGFVQGRMGACV